MLSPRPLRPNNSRRISGFRDVGQGLPVVREGKTGVLVDLGADDQSWSLSMQTLASASCKSSARFSRTAFMSAARLGSNRS